MEQQPSKDQLIRSMGVAGIIAAVALLLFILPAEYGLDPTGFGTAIGLVHEDAPTSDVLNVQAGPIQDQAWTIQLVPGGGWKEHKLAMSEGMGIIYAWNATTPVQADFHHDQLGSFDNRVSPASNGTFTAPIDGSFGWAFRSPDGSAATVELRVIGYWLADA